MLVQSLSIQHSTTYSAMCPAARPASSPAAAPATSPSLPATPRVATWSASAPFLSSVLAMASSAVSSVAASGPSGAALPATSSSAAAGAGGAAASPSAAGVAVDDDPYDFESVWIPELEAEPGPYSIRVPEPSGDTRCPRCRSRFLAAGPTGHAGELPICDLCLLDGSKSLGMVMALTAVARTFGAADRGSEEEYREASEELATFARLFEIVAAKFGPRRPFRLPAGASEC